MHWCVVSAHVRTSSFVSGVELVAAIGRLIEVLADAEGNEACVPTWLGREERRDAGNGRE